MYGRHSRIRQLQSNVVIAKKLHSVTLTYFLEVKHLKLLYLRNGKS